MDPVFVYEDRSIGPEVTVAEASNGVSQNLTLNSRDVSFPFLVFGENEITTASVSVTVDTIP